MPDGIRAPPSRPTYQTSTTIIGGTMDKKRPPPEGGNLTPDDELKNPSEMREGPQQDDEAAYTDIIPTRTTVSNERGFEVTVIEVGLPDGGERRRWLEQLLFGRYRLDTILEEIDYPDPPPSGVGAKPIR